MSCAVCPQLGGAMKPSVYKIDDQNIMHFF
jgi:hypothetical protein